MSLVAKVNVIIRHNRINGIKVMLCRTRGLLVWPPSSVDISMECRDLIVEQVKAKGFAPKEVVGD